MIEVELKPSEYAMAVYLSSVREHVNKMSGVYDRQMGRDDGFKIGVDGLVAEIAVCKHFNVCPDLSFEPRGGGHDCVINGRRVDVKSTKVGRWDVFIPARKQTNKIDRYIWCWVDFRKATILGWFAPKDIFDDQNLQQSPRPDEFHYAVNLKSLRKFKENK